MKYQSNVVITRDVAADKVEMMDYGMNREVIIGNHKEPIDDDTTSDKYRWRLNVALFSLNTFNSRLLKGLRSNGK